MKFMVMVKATQESEDDVMPSVEALNEMTDYNEQLVKAGIMLAGEGLKSSRHGSRVRFLNDGGRSVIDGPFAETKELVAGFWILQCKSLEECVEWVKRCPNPMNEESEIEIREIFDSADFPEGEWTAKEEQLREQLGAGK